MPPCRGDHPRSRKATSIAIKRLGMCVLYKDYFDVIMPLYKAKAFRRWYRMSRELFLVILNGVRDYDDYFKAKYD
jgi:hypothetical protein